jgi:hypothetical protein
MKKTLISLLALAILSINPAFAQTVVDSSTVLTTSSPTEFNCVTNGAPITVTLPTAASCKTAGVAFTIHYTQQNVSVASVNIVTSAGDVIVGPNGNEIDLLQPGQNVGLIPLSTTSWGLFSPQMIPVTAGGTGVNAPQPGDLFYAGPAGSLSLLRLAKPSIDSFLVYQSGHYKWLDISVVGDNTGSDPDLTNSTGLVTQTGPNAFVARSLATADSTHISITNPSTVGGNPTFDIGSAVTTNAGSQTLTNKVIAASQLTGTIPSGLLAVTQSPLDASQKFSTTAYTDGAVAAAKSSPTITTPTLTTPIINSGGTVNGLLTVNNGTTIHGPITIDNPWSTAQVNHAIKSKSVQYTTTAAFVDDATYFFMKPLDRNATVTQVTVCSNFVADPGSITLQIQNGNFSGPSILLGGTAFDLGSMNPSSCTVVPLTATSADLHVLAINPLAFTITVGTQGTPEDCFSVSVEYEEDDF